MSKYILYGIGIALLVVGGLFYAVAPLLAIGMIMLGLGIAGVQLWDQRTTDVKVNTTFEYMLSQTQLPQEGRPWLNQALKVLKSNRFSVRSARELARLEPVHQQDPVFYAFLALYWLSFATQADYNARANSRATRYLNDANRHIRKGLALAPLNPQLLIAEGIALDLSGEHSKAQISFRKSGLTPKHYPQFC